MTTKQHLTSAARTYVGAGVVPEMLHTNERKGVPVDFITKFDMGSPIALDANALIAAATGAELPNNATKTYTTADHGTSPIDDAGKRSVASTTMNDGKAYSVWVLDVPRNITLGVTHDTAIVAVSVTVTGYDQWGAKMVETLSVTATGTSKTAAGKKAFKYIYSIAITSAGNATADTLNLGFGDVLGLPYAIQAKEDLLKAFFNTAADTSGTLVVADATTATATTGDVRGTWTPGSSNDGSKVVLWYSVQSRSTAVGLAGVAQYAG